MDKSPLRTTPPTQKAYGLEFPGETPPPPLDKSPLDKSPLDKTPIGQNPLDKPAPQVKSPAMTKASTILTSPIQGSVLLYRPREGSTLLNRPRQGSTLKAKTRVHPIVQAKGRVNNTVQAKGRGTDQGQQYCTDQGKGKMHAFNIGQMFTYMEVYMKSSKSLLFLLLHSKQKLLLHYKSYQ